MEALECILSRRSVRRFEEKPIEPEKMGLLLEAVRFAPSWKNTQCWQVFVVQDSEIKVKIQSSLTPNNPAAKSIIQAPAVVVLCAEKGVSGLGKDTFETDKGDWFMYDIGVAAQNFCLAAHSLGLGSVHVGAFDAAIVDASLEISYPLTSVIILPIGYPTRIGNAPPRKEINEFTHYR